jgi:hypothetical protein
MIDVILILVVAGVAWCVASEGPWGAASTLIAVIVAGLLAMNFFEPLASKFPSSIEWRTRADIISLLGLFAVFTMALRMACEYVMPTQIEVHPLAYNAMRWGLAAATGYVTMAILLTALHTAPLPREFMGFRPERANLLDAMAPDRQWLAFTQHTSEHIFTTGNIFDGDVFPRFEGRDSEVWSSFPIRYAERRERYASSGGASGFSAPPPSTPAAGPPSSVSPSGNGGGTSGF